MTIIENAYAKINLGLDILGLRPDKYHEVAMIMQSVSLQDCITITPAAELLVTTDDERLGGGPDNLAYKAAVLMGQCAGLKPEVHIHIQKKIFMAAGLAGGSADAAAVLRGLNRYWQLNLPMDKLERLGAKLGSDVPFCICGGTSLATGRGEVLKALPDLPKQIIVLAKPKVEVSTPWAYREYDKQKNVPHPDIKMLKEAILKHDMDMALSYCGNVLELVTIPKHGVIANIKEKMLAAGAVYALMSGSGPTVFGVCENESVAQAVADALVGLDLEIAVTESVERSR